MPESDLDGLASDYRRTSIENPWTFICGSIGAVLTMIGVALAFSGDGSDQISPDIPATWRQVVGIGILLVAAMFAVGCLVMVGVTYELRRRR